MTIAQDVRAAVRAAHNSCCGYCGVSETLVGGELEIDHFRPFSRGGADTPANLVYACTTCNRFKGDYWPEEDAPDSFRLLHPSRDDRGAHILDAANGRLVGLTPRGWFHIRWLHLNRPQLIALRQLRRSEQDMREALAQARAAKAELQQRINQLETETAQLREVISRLTGAES